MKKIILLFVIFLLVNFVSADNIYEKDVFVTILLENILNTSTEYNNLLLIKNHNDTPSFNDDLSVEVYWNLSGINYFFEYKINKSINYYSSSGFGYVNINSSGNYLFCTKIKSNNYFDPNLINNFQCKNLSFVENLFDSTNQTFINSTSKNISQNMSENETINESEFNTGNVDCDCSLNLNLSKNILEYGEQLKFKIDDCDSSSKLVYETSYWIEDLYGKLLKKAYFTTSKSEKSFTPKYDKDTPAFIFANNNCSNEVFELVVFKGEENELKEPFLNVEYPNSVDDNFFLTLEGYKGDSGKSLVSVWVEEKGGKVSEVSKFYVENKYSNFKFKIPIILKDVDFSGNYELKVEGLDFSKTFDINIKKDKKINNVKINSLKEKIEPYKIISFYTRKKNFENIIPIYINTNVNDCLLKISSLKEIKEIKSQNKTVSTNISIQNPDEFLKSELYCDDAFQDVVLLKLNLSKINFIKEKNTSQYPVIKNNNNKNNLLTGNSILEIVSKEKTEESSLISNNSDENEPFSLILIIILSIFGLVILFKKELLNILKKTKLFKRKLNS
ncbi:hypothetical protein K9L67_00250 [Candidatus Woesearchaeota archaeon]|nr:hypothetical protein [Candidatus Woesearchaeota archaeon]MCF7900637.1 hypothetical protein [Candidatus Woesearchaeota archaeon]MCF8013477.1 hypothetical protein [Candidatus Woesearchaeota archaeon]